MPTTENCSITKKVLNINSKTFLGSLWIIQSTSSMELLWILVIKESFRDGISAGSGKMDLFLLILKWSESVYTVGPVSFRWMLSNSHLGISLSCQRNVGSESFLTTLSTNWPAFEIWIEHFGCKSLVSSYRCKEGNVFLFFPLGGQCSDVLQGERN